MKNNLIQIRGLNKYFSNTQTRNHVLQNINIDIEEGSFTVIRGESGAGKTTLLRILGLLDNEFDGLFTCYSKNISTLTSAQRDQIRSEGLGFVFQESMFLDHLTISENIVLPLEYQGKKSSFKAEALENTSKFIFRAAEINGGILSINPPQASGGQKQRASLARAIITNPKLILADEPTASLDFESRCQVRDKLVELNKAGTTIIVVSHDPIFFEVGDQYALLQGSLHTLNSSKTKKIPQIHNSTLPPTSSQASQETVWNAWKPRLAISRILLEIWINLIRRPLFSALTLITLMAGTCQVAIFISLLGGVDQIIENAASDGSRLTRLTIRPQASDLNSENRFPRKSDIAALLQVAEAIPRRSASFSVSDHSGKQQPFQTIGLHNDDPELKNFQYLAGNKSSISQETFGIIVTTGFLAQILNIPHDNDESSINWNNFIGQNIIINVPRFNRTGQKVGEEVLKLHVSAVILQGENGREFYVPNTLLVGTDRIKRDRTGEFSLPLNHQNSGWANDADFSKITNWAWEDMLHVYVKNVDSVLPVMTTLVGFGYRPEAEIWEYLWVLDLKQAAMQIFIPILTLLTAVIGLVLVSNVYISARLRENELALCRVLGMGRGDLLAIEIFGLIALSFISIGLGLTGAQVIIEIITNQFAAQAEVLANIPESSATQITEKLFTPVTNFAGYILVATIFLVTVAGLWPSLNVAKTDPAKVFSRP